MPFVKQHVGQPVVVRIDQEALQPPDLTVEGMDVLSVADFCFAQRNDVFDIGLHGS